MTTNNHNQTEALKVALEAIATAAGCFDAAYIEGLSEAIAETTDERLKDLLIRRILFANEAVQGALRALLGTQAHRQEIEREAFERWAFERWAKSHGGLPTDSVGSGGGTRDGLFPATYWNDRTEIAWRAWANKPARAALGQPSAPAEPVACGGRDYCSRFPFCGCGAEPLFPERDPSKPAEQQGIFRKFDVRRVDGSDAPGGKHYGCRYYVLDLDHDKHAPAAMRAYAAECRKTHPQLADDIEREFGVAAPVVPDTAQPQDEYAPAVNQCPYCFTFNGHQPGCGVLGTTVQIETDEAGQARELPPLPEDESCVHIYPWDLERMETNECTATVFSVAVGCPEGKSVPLYTADQMREYARAAQAAPAVPDTDRKVMVPDGWVFMRHPSRNDGDWLPARILVEDGVKIYIPWEENGCDFEWDRRDEKWEVLSAAKNPDERGSEG